MMFYGSFGGSDKRVGRIKENVGSDNIEFKFLLYLILLSVILDEVGYMMWCLRMQYFFYWTVSFEISYYCMWDLILNILLSNVT